MPVLPFHRSKLPKLTELGSTPSLFRTLEQLP